MATSKRVTTVQVPGETAEQTPIVTDADVGLADESKAESPAAPAAATDRPSRRQYAQMHSSQVDASTLTSAVLCKDGWVAPNPKAKA